MANPEVLSETEFRTQINEAADQWGRAHLTKTEWGTICQTRIGSSWSAVSENLLKGKIPPPQEVNENDFVSLAVQHGCPVAYSLYLLPERTLEDLVWSYTMKNRAFRFFAREIDDESLLKEWKGIETKRDNEIGVKDLIRPERVPNNELIGIEKAACYFPCQLLKEIEAIRAGRGKLLGPMDKQPIPLDDDERKLLRIPWEMYREAINRSKNIKDLAANIAVETFEILRDRKLNEEKIISLLFQGYRPHGPLLEHGQLSRIIEIWQLIGHRLDSRYNTHLWQEIVTVIGDAINEYNEKAEELGTPPLIPSFRS